MNKFEQLIEYVINDEDQKARELFHDIVVAKSREIYESMMAEEAEEEELDEAEEEEELDESAEEELDEAEEEEELDEGFGEDTDPMDEIEQEEISMEDDEGDDDMGGDASDDFIDNVEAGDDDGAEFGGEEGGEEAATKDDILNLEDKLDQLMAEFEAAMGGDDMGTDGDGFGADEGGDAIGMDDTEEMVPMAENITLKQVHPKTTTSEEGNGKPGPVTFNSGQRGMAAKPVKTGADSPEGPHDTAAYRKTTKDLIGKVGNSPAQSTQTLKPATKPHLGQASGVNNKSPLPSGTKG